MTLWQEGQMPGASAQVASAFHMCIISDCTLRGQVVYKLRMTLIMSLAEKQSARGLTLRLAMQHQKCSTKCQVDQHVARCQHDACVCMKPSGACQDAISSKLSIPNCVVLLPVADVFS